MSKVLYKDSRIYPLLDKDYLNKDERELLCELLFKEIAHKDLMSVRRYLLIYMISGGDRETAICKSAEILTFLTRLTADVCDTLGRGYTGGKVALFNELQVRVLQLLHGVDTS